jgi:hypothetical protein
MAKPSVRNDAAKVLDTALLHGIKRIGHVTNIDHKLVRKLLIADRDFAFIRIRQVGQGDTVKAQYTCANLKCEAKLEADIDLSSLRVFNLKDGEAKTDGDVRYFELKNNELGIDADVRYPDGDDQAAIAKVAQDNPIEASHIMFSRCLRRWGKQSPPFGPLFFDNQPIKTIDWLSQEFSDHLPGMETISDLECGHCGEKTSVNIQASDFLFKVPKQRVA